MNNPDPLNVRPHDPLTKWKREAEEQAEITERTRRVEEAERRRREEQQAQQQDTVAELRTELTKEVADLRDELKVSRETIIDVTGEAMEKLANKIFDDVDQKILAVETKLFDYAAQRFGELMGRIDAILPERRSFKRFANESIADDELPNWRTRDKSTTH
jgi:hypothetical protein